MIKKEFRWLLVLPPLGSARTQGLAIVQAFQREMSDAILVFDTQEILHQLHSRLRTEEEVVALDWMNQQLLVRALEGRISHLLCLTTAPLDPHYLNLLRAQGVVTVHWLYEDIRLADYWSQVLTAYDFFCSNQRGPVERGCVENDVPFCLLPLGAQSAPTGSPAFWHARSLDLAFYGSLTPYRVQVLETLASAGLSLGIVGEGWEGYQGFLSRSVLRPDDEIGLNGVGLFRQARMALQLPMGKQAEGLDEGPVNPSVWDSIAAGAFPMVERLPANAWSLEGLMYQEYSNPTELLAMCMSLRQSGGVDHQVLVHNQKCIQKSHMLSHRVRKLFEFVDFS